MCTQSGTDTYTDTHSGTDTYTDTHSGADTYTDTHSGTGTVKLTRIFAQIHTLRCGLWTPKLFSPFWCFPQYTPISSASTGSCVTVNIHICTISMAQIPQCTHTHSYTHTRIPPTHPAIRSVLFRHRQRCTERRRHLLPHDPTGGLAFVCE